MLLMILITGLKVSKLLLLRSFSIMFLILWVSLLLPPVISSQDNYFDDTIKKKSQQPAIQLYRDKRRSQIYVAMKGEEEQVVYTVESKCWECDRSGHLSMKLKSDLGNEVYDKCLNLSNQIKRWTPEVTKTYPDERKKIVFQNCILENKWIREIPKRNVENSQILFYRRVDSMFKFNREKDAKQTKYYDCLYDAKQVVKIVPNDCYWTNNTAKNTFEVFMNFWNNIGPDIMYTYDFVLYSEDFAERRENSLWYLIAYLRMLAMEMDNPMTIVKLVEEYSSYKELFKKYKQSLKLLEVLVLHLIEKRVTFKSNLRVSNRYDFRQTNTGRRQKDEVYIPRPMAAMEGELELDKYKNWQSDESEKLISDLGIEVYNKCLKFPNQTEISTSNVSKTYIRNKILFQNCILENRWKKEIAIRNVERSPSLFLRNYASMFNFNRVIHEKYHKYVDCLFWTRQVVRQVPKNCYWKDSTNNKVDEFWNFFNIFGPDLMYTFDFVLYSEVDNNRKENSLWYLIAFLRTIAINVENPMSIVKHILGCVDYNKILEEYIKSSERMITIALALVKSKAIRNKIEINYRPRSLFPVKLVITNSSSKHTDDHLFN